MGRKTWESLPRALPERQNIVVTRQPGYAAIGADVAASLDDALALVRLPAPVFCIGGGELFREALGRAQRLYLTEIDRDFSGDATFPPWRDGRWKEVARETGRAEGPDGFDVRVRHLRARGIQSLSSRSNRETRKPTHVRRSLSRTRSARSRGRARGAFGRSVRRQGRGHDGDLRDDRRAVRLHGGRDAERRR